MASRESLRTAAQEVLLAAAELSGGDREEFSEWDLTVVVWKRSPNRFGCRKYEDRYPDHKRVMMEIMGKTRDNPLRRGWIERTRKNHYRVTALGLAEAQRIESAPGAAVDVASRSPAHVYDALEPYLDSRVFLRFCKNSAEPRTWLDAATFLGITKNTAGHLKGRLRALAETIKTARAWFESHSAEALRRGPTGGGRAYRRMEVDKLEEFGRVLEERFAVQMDALRSSKD